ncbi:serine/threonine-protein kinase [Streptomyces sp. NPDC045431]|uniref:serine/threonine-protein kinase n=1 Tax=Streptomyces sp. NPDC045431 TaxID=3155613 RepID=UPI0033C67A0A
MTGNPLRPPLPGDPRRLGRWELCGRLGEGGMGTVHLGRHGRRLAAVKTLRAELAGDAHFTARFRREAKTARAARSRYVAAVLELGLDGPVPWFATEFVAGPTLEACVEGRGPLPEPGVRALGGMLARALVALHRAGVVHRDLKPSNVLLTADGLRVVDFGIARRLDATSLTRTGQLPGSEGYMSPEQVLGRELGPHSDLFVLGALLTYASTGHHAFGAGQHLAAYAIAHEEPQALDGVPAALREPVRRCLRKEPGERPTAAELAAEWPEPPRGGGWLPQPVLDDIAALRHRAAELSGVRVTEAPGAGPGRRRLLAAGGAALLAGSGAGGGAWWWFTRGPGGPGGTGDSGDPEPPPGVPLWKGAPGKVPGPLWSLDTLDPEPPFGPTAAGDVVLAAAPGAVVALDPRTGERRWTRAAARPPVAAPRPLLLGADGTLLALGPRTGEEVWRGPGGLTRLLAAGPDTVYALDASHRIVAVRTGDGSRLWQTPSPTADDGAAARAVPREALLLADADGRVHALDSRTGATRWTLTAGARALPPAYGTDTAVLGGPALRAVALRDGAERWRVAPASPGGFGAPLVVGTRVYVTDGDVMRCLDAASGADVWEHTSDGGVYAAATAPFTVAGGVYLPLADVADGVVALPLGGGREQYRFQAAGSGTAWAGTAAGGAVLWQCGARLYALPPF